MILAGGLGTRLREETEFKPKPMVEIGGVPILWHIMKILYTQGITEFVICLGYKGEVIRDYFINYSVRNHDIYLDFSDSSFPHLIARKEEIEKWKVSLVDTGSLTPTGGRLHYVKHLLQDEPFLCTYGDGVADIHLDKLISFHASHNGLATVTAVNPPSRFGAVDLTEDFRVATFEEKPGLNHWINGGFFIFENEIFDFLNESSNLEQDVLPVLARKCELWAYQHNGFWKPMDTLRETRELHDLFVNGLAPWKIW